MFHVFVSYAYEDRAHKENVARWAAQGLLGDVRVTGETADVRPEGDDAIRKHLAARLRPCNALLVLVGQNSHNRPWLDYEVQFAKSHHIPVFVARVPGTTGAPPPAVRSYTLLTLDPSALRRAFGT